ncbi:MAG: choice-of-anchor D domain-containing protein [Myxococcales bacterium]|nr:choice-of-anchor D domain-containing protein [Myxococcales bacterium]
MDAFVTRFLPKQARKLLMWSMLLFVFGGLQTACPEEKAPPPVLPEIEVTPDSWNIGEVRPAGLRIYKKFVIRNKIEATATAQDLEVKSIKLDAAASQQFKLIDDKCPIGADEQECVSFPSVPFKLKPGETKEFSVEFTFSNSNDFQTAKVQIVSNTKNVDDPTNIADVTTEIRMQTRGGEPKIDVSAQVVGDKEFLIAFGKIEKGKNKEESVIITNTGTTGELKFRLQWSTEEASGSFTIKDSAGAVVDLNQDFTLTPANNMEFKIEYTPKVCGEHKAALDINSNSVFQKWDQEKGQPPAAQQLSLRLEGSSPTRGSVDSPLMNFTNVAVGMTDTKTFKITPDAANSFCDLQIFDLKLASDDGKGAAPTSLSFGKFRKGGQEVSAPTQAAPIVLAKGEELEVEVIFAPTNQTALAAGVVVTSNDPAFADPTSGIVVSISAGTEVNIPPFARFTFLCAEESGNVCKAADVDKPISNPVFLGGERPRVKLDPSASFDREGKITAHKWTLEVPSGSLSKLSDPSIANPTFLLDVRGEYKVTLEVTDEGGLKGTKSETLKVED